MEPDFSADSRGGGGFSRRRNLRQLETNVGFPFSRERERQRETSVFRYASSQKASYDTYGMINHDGGSRRLVILSATLYILAKYAQKERKERKKEKK